MAKATQLEGDWAGFPLQCRCRTLVQIMFADLAFPLTEGVLVLSSGFCAVDPFRIGHLPVRRRPVILVAALLSVVLGVVCAESEWSVRGVPNWAVELVSYGGVLTLATAASRWTPRRGVRFTILAAVTILSLLLACLFPLTLLIDREQHGNTRMSAAYRFSAEWFGGAWSSHDSAVLSLYRTYWWLPFMERRVWHQRLLDSECDFERTTERWSTDRSSFLISCPGLGRVVVLKAE